MEAASRQPSVRERLKPVLPLYAAGYGVILCALGSLLATDGEAGFASGGLWLVALGFVVSIACRLRQWRQNSMLGLLVGLVVIALFLFSLDTVSPLSFFAEFFSGGRSTGPGLVLAWFLVLYSFAMIADEVIVFSVVPSVALLGLMASENLNSEIVVYFLGMVYCAVFMLIYESQMARGLVPGIGAASTSRPKDDPDSDGLRTALLLSVAVLVVAVVGGALASVPFQWAGGKLGGHTPGINLPASRAYASEAPQRYFDQLELSGAPPRLSDRVVMYVSAEAPVGGIAPLHWRGRVFDSYTGSAWTSPSPQLHPMKASGRTYEATALAPYESKGRVLLSQRVAVLAPIGDAILAAAEPQRFEVFRPRRYQRQGDQPRRMDLLQEDEYRVVSITQSIARLHYEVESLFPNVSANDLRRAKGDIPRSLLWRNTLLDDVEPGVRAQRLAIAQRVTQGAKTQYDRVSALNRYLQQSFTYTLTPPRTSRSNDAVLFFLTESKQGYCEIFASSLAVLCRELGIPARLATGFATGEWDAQSRAYAVKENDLHAWTEVFFPGYGWIPFDPTSSRSADASVWANVREQLTEALGRFAGRGAGPGAVITAFLLVLAFLAKVFVLDPLREAVWWRLLAVTVRKGPLAPERWDLLHARSAGRLAREAGRRRPGETAREFAERASASITPDAAATLREMTRLYCRAAFRAEPPSEAEFAELQRLDGELARRLRRPGAQVQPEAA